MARRNNEPVSAMDKAKVRVFFAEVEGNNDSVQEALKTMVSAMNRPTRALSEQKANGSAPVLLPPENGVEEVDDANDEGENLELFDEASASSNARKTRGTGRKVDRNAGLALVPNMDFRPTGKRALKEFLDEKNPKNDIEAALATVYYMQHVTTLSKIGPNHVMTAFKEAGKSIPVDLRQTIRNAKKLKMWVNFTDIDDVRTTTQGDNFVEHEMGKGE